MPVIGDRNNLTMEKKKRIQYSVGAINEAVAAIQSGMPFKTASIIIYKIPRSTLQDKVKDRTRNRQEIWTRNGAD